MSDVPAGKIFKGQNKRVDPNDLDADTSPDCCNCDHYKGMVGTLGPRLGRTFVNSEAFIGRLTGIIPFNLPNALSVVLPTSDGDLIVADSPKQGFDEPPNDPFSYPLGGYSGTWEDLFTSSTPITVSHPTSAGSSTWNVASPYTASAAQRIKLVAGIEATIAAPTTDLTIALRYGAVINGVTTYLGTQTFTANRYAATALRIGLPSAPVSGPEMVFPQTVTTGTITALALAVTVTWPSGAGGGDTVVVTPIGLA